MLAEADFEDFRERAYAVYLLAQAYQELGQAGADAGIAYFLELLKENK